MKYCCNNRRRAQKGTVVDYLLPSLEANNPVEFAQEQADYQPQLINKAAQDLAAEERRVQRVRSNVIPTAQRISDLQSNWTEDEKDAYYDYEATSWDLRGQGADAIKKELYRRADALPQNVKDAIPDEGRYNLWKLSPETITTGRPLYCTSMGCFAYNEAGASDVPMKEEVVGSNQRFQEGVKAGRLPFERIQDSEREPGDIALMVGEAPVSYTQDLGRTTRAHHTTIYSKDNEKTGNDPNNPQSIDAFSAQGGSREFFEERDQDLETDYEFYRYIGQTPQRRRDLRDARNNQVQADLVAKALRENAEKKEGLKEYVEPIQSLGPNQIPTEDTSMEIQYPSLQSVEAPKPDKKGKREAKRQMIKDIKADYQSQIDALKANQ